MEHSTLLAQGFDVVNLWLLQKIHKLPMPIQLFIIELLLKLLDVFMSLFELGVLDGYGRIQVFVFFRYYIC
jgi:hypothetical protein